MSREDALQLEADRLYAEVLRLRGLLCAVEYAAKYERAERLADAVLAIAAQGPRK